MAYKILVADDSPAYKKIIKEIFRIVGKHYELIYADNGKEAYEMAQKEFPDLVLMDVIMPELNGIQALKLLKENPDTEDIPVIVLSASESLKAAFETGATDFIPKPFKHYELLIRVSAALTLVEKIRQIKNQKEQLEQQKKDIIDDITYAKRIQKSSLPSELFIKKLFPNHFILNIPRNIVSGDFYWIAEKEGKKIIVAADCTGHGISGALMTMAGIAFLNEIINKYDVQKANDILFLLREKVVNMLQQRGKGGDTSDGMDIALCILDTEKKELQFSGANNPLYKISRNQLEIIKGDRMPIGIHVNYNKPFTNHRIKIHQNDLIYLFSDGYADQFGGVENKKFRY